MRSNARSPTGTIAIPPRIVVRGSHTRGMAQVVTHELTHRLVAACLPDAPVWLHEGLAMYFETIPTTSTCCGPARSSPHTGRPVRKRTRWSLR